MFRAATIATLIFISASCLADESFFKPPDDWVDPGDMFSYDTTTKTNKYPKQRSQVHSEQENGLTQVERVEKKVKEVLPEPVAVPVQSDAPPPRGQHSCQHPFLRRFVAVLMNKFHGLVHDSSAVLEMKLQFSSEDLRKLRMYSEKCSGSVQEITRILELMMRDVTIPESRPLLERWFHMKANDVIIASILFLVFGSFLTMEWLSTISWWRQFTRFLLLCLCCTFVWTYMHEYQKVKNAAISDMSNIPERCVNKFYEETFFESIKSSIVPYVSVNGDPCAKYHENLGVNPLVKVTPTKIIAITFSQFVFEPLEHFGTSFGRLVRNTFHEVPVTLWIPTIILLAIILMFALAFLTVYLGYTWSFSLPFWTGFQIGPSDGASKSISDEVLHLRDANKKLMDQIERQQEQERLKIEYPPQPDLPRARSYPAVEDVSTPPYPIYDLPMDRGDNTISASTVRKRLQARKVPSAPPAELPYPCHDNLPLPSPSYVANDADDVVPLGFEHIHVEDCPEDDSVDISPSKK